MKRYVLSICMLAVSLLTACFASPAESKNHAAPTTASSSPVPTTAVMTTTPTATTPTTPSIPEHSPLYIDGVDVEDVIIYFNEVCLDAEIINSGDPSVVQKWTVPISYRIHGNPTADDLDTIATFTEWLNTVEGFPGIYEAAEYESPKLNIHFENSTMLPDIMGDSFDNVDGAVTFWYDGFDQIYNATIFYCTDIDQTLRSSVILEEIYNGLGPLQDTALREDSIIYAEFSQPQELTTMDELLLRLLYHPDMLCGMNAAECEQVIRTLYY